MEDKTKEYDQEHGTYQDTKPEANPGPKPAAPSPFKNLHNPEMGGGVAEAPSPSAEESKGENDAR